MKSHKELIVWQESIEVVKEVYRITRLFSRDEIHGLTDQMRRCAVSIPSNIAEGHNRFGTREYAQFVQIAYGSAAELDTQLIIAKELNYIDSSTLNNISEKLEYVSRMLNKLLLALRNK